MVSSNIKDTREKYGFTQEELAEILQIATSNLSRWESKERPVPAYIWRSLNFYLKLREISYDTVKDYHKKTKRDRYAR